MRRALPLLIGLLAAAGCGQEAERPADDSPKDFTPIVEDPPEAVDEGRWRVARVTRRTQLRARPSGRVLETIGRRTEFESRRVLSVVGSREGWLRVLVPELPNGRSGWIPERAAKVTRTDLWIEVDRSRRRARLMRDEKLIRAFPVAVGRPGNETPLGRFAVTDKLDPKKVDSVYGCCAVALTGHQTKLVPGWPGGDRLAIHGTPQEETVGHAVSLGCMRGHAKDLRALMRRVPLGAPVVIRR